MSTGKITKKMTLKPSTSPMFKASKGWLMFPYQGWTFYVLLAPSGVKMMAMHGHKMYTATTHRKGSKKPKKPTSGMKTLP